MTMLPEGPDANAPAPAGAAARQRMVAIGLMSAALFLFSLLDASAKHLGETYHPAQVAWARFAGHAVLAVVMVNPWSVPGGYRTNWPMLQLVRSVLLACTTLLNFWALQTLRLDQTITIFFTTPLLIAIIAGPMLGEWVGPRRLAAIFVGLVGVMVVTRPGIAEWQPAYLISISSAFLYALYSLLTRMVGSTDSSWTSFLYVPMIGTLAVMPALPGVWITPQTAFDLGLMCVLGVLGGVGHLLLIIAHRRAPAAALAPFIYLQLVWMASLGWLVFGDRPDIWTVAGAAIVVGSGLYVFLRERKVKSATDL